MNRYPILDVCARIEGHEVQHNMLQNYCSNFDDWDGLLQQAEREGVTPLLRKHLVESESSYPASVQRSLNILARRHLHQSKVRIEVLQEILELYRRNELTPIVLKGAALCHTLYADPALRPMRDMDLLLNNDEVDFAQEILRNAGFKQSSSPIPNDHHHLPSLYKTTGGMTVCIELHRGLYPNCPPYYPEVDFKKLLAGSKIFKIGDTSVLTFNNEEMLHYLYQHAFRAPLAYAPYKLINVADVIGFTEKSYTELDWEKIRQDFPLLHKALPLMHHISPWDFSKIPVGFVKKRDKKRRLSTTPFTGWPLKRFKEYKATGGRLHQVLLDTFFPSSWWFQVYYGVETWRERLWTSLVKHPLHVYWWVGIYSYLFDPVHPWRYEENSDFISSTKLKLSTAVKRGWGFIKKMTSL